MIVTSSTLLGLTSINGSAELHLAMLVMLLLKVDMLHQDPMPIGPDTSEHHMSPGKLYKLAVANHAYLATTCLLN